MSILQKETSSSTQHQKQFYTRTHQQFQRQYFQESALPSSSQSFAMSSLQVSLMDRLNSTLQDNNVSGNLSALKESISGAGILASPSSFGDSLFPLGILNFRNIAAAFLFLIFAFALRIVINKRKWEKENKALTLQHGCVEPKALKTHWFFGIDRPIQMWKAGKEGHILEFLRAIIAETGNTFTWTAFGARVWGTQDPENVKALFFTKEKSFSHEVRKEVLVALVGESIFTQDGAEWKHTRGLLKPSLFAPHYQNSTLFEEHVDDLIAQVRRDGTGGAEVNLSPLFFALTIDVTTSFLFGKSLYTLRPGMTSKAGREFGQAWEFCQVYLSKRYQLGRNASWMNSKEFQAACKIVHNYVDSVVHDAMEEKKNILEERKSEGGPAKVGKNGGLLGELVLEVSDPIQARSHLMHLLLAGRDTTACLLSWTFRLLSKHQDVQAKIRAEIQETFGSSPAEVSITRQMPYLTNVLKEVLRLYPSLPANSRTAAEDVVLPVGGGPDGKSPVLVRKGEDVAVCVYSMHRRKDIFGPDATVFRPDRWENGALDHLEGTFAYFPFHGGRRVCPGQRFALAEASYAIVRLFQAFPSITLAPGREFPELGVERQTLGMTLAPTDGTWVQVGA